MYTLLKEVLKMALKMMIDVVKGVFPIPFYSHLFLGPLLAQIVSA